MAPAKAVAQVVVLGAGAAGIYIARALRGQANVTIVDRSVRGRLLPADSQQAESDAVLP